MRKSVMAFTFGMLSFVTLASGALAGCGRADSVELVLEARGSVAASDEVMEKTREVVARRIGALGRSAGTVTRQGPDRILVRLARREDAEPVKSLIGHRGRLEFRLVDTSVIPAQEGAGELPPGTEVLPQAGVSGGRIPVRRRAIISGGMIADAQPGFDWSGQPTVTIRFDPAGTRRFAQVTRDNVGRPFAIVLDDVVISAPVINEPILGGTAQISGGFTVEESNRLAISLRSGALPVDLAVVEERVLAP